VRSSSFHCTSSPGSKPMAAARARGRLTYLIKHTAVASRPEAPFLSSGPSRLRTGHLGLPHPPPANSLCGAIREVHKGNTFFGPSIPCHLHKWNPKK